MANEGKQTPALFPCSCVSGDDWGMTITFTDAIDTDTFKAGLLLNGSEVLAITCTPNTVAKSVALSLTDTQTSTLSGVYQYYFERTRAAYTLTLLADNFEFLDKK